MSRSSMYVRYPDGTVRYGIFNETVNAAWEPLYDDLGDAWDAWEAYYREPTIGRPNTQWVTPQRPSWEPVDVDVFVVSGVTTGKAFTASADVGYLLSRPDPDDPDWVYGSVPKWVRAAIKAAAL